MKSSAKNIRLSSLDDLFSTEETRQEAQADAGREKVRMIPLDELTPLRIISSKSRMTKPCRTPWRA